MKKTTIFTLFLLFIIGFVVVGFFGMDIRVIYPTVYVNEIVWENSLELDEKFDVYKFDEPNQDTGANAQLEYFCKDTDLPLKINIKCTAKPLDATNTLLDYAIVGAHGTTIEVKQDNTCNVLFTRSDAPTLIVTSNDVEDAIYIIQFVVVSI